MDALVQRAWFETVQHLYNHSLAGFNSGLKIDATLDGAAFGSHENSLSAVFWERDERDGCMLASTLLRVTSAQLAGTCTDCWPVVLCTVSQPC